MTQTTSYAKATAAETSRKPNAAPYCVESAKGDSPVILPISSTETLSLNTTSVISGLFSKFNTMLTVAIEAERDLDHGNGCDPAIDHWLREAECAWGAVNDVGKALRAAPVTRADDRPLVAMAGIADAIMNSETMSDLGAAHNQLRAATFIRQQLGRKHITNRINEMLDQCHAHLLQVAELDFYQPVCDFEDLSYGLNEAWPEAC